VVPLPPGAVLDAAAGTFTWTPGYTQSGTWSMTVTVTDGAATATAPLVVTVANTNRPPVLSGSGPAQVDEGTEWSLSLSATDPDGTSVVLSCAGLPAGAALETLASRVRWTPGYTQAGAFTFTCSASDGSLSAQASFSVTVRHVNLPPSWPNTPPPPLHEGTEGALALGASDPDGDTLSYSATGLPPGAAYDPASGLLTWTPGFDQAGSWPLTLTASDGQTSSSRSLLVVVADTNLPPSLSSLPAQTVSEGHLLEVTVTGTDGDGDALTWSASGLPVGATFDTATLRFRWRPEFGRVGTYTVTFTARDEQLAASATLSVTVTPGNRPPELFVPGPKVLDESELVTFTVSGVDPEGEPVSFGARDLPPGSTFDPGSRTFSWIPTYEQSGRWTVTFTASDGSESAEASVVLTVGDVNRGPTLTPVRPQDVFVGAPVIVTFNAVDPEGDPVTFSSETLPAGASLDASSGRLDWVPTEAQVGQAVVRVRASDSGGLGSEISVTFRVQGTLVTGCAAAPGAGGLWALALSLSILAGRARRR
jgi:hypothetical protein